METNWIKIYETANPYQANLVEVLLKEHEIPAVILNKQDTAYGVFGLVEVHVHLSDIRTAEGLIETLEL